MFSNSNFSKISQSSKTKTKRPKFRKNIKGSKKILEKMYVPHL